jgi:hypothetical protein
MENAETGEVDQFDLGHGLVEKVVNIISKRVLERRGFKGPEKKANEVRNQRLKLIEDELLNMKTMIQQIKDIVKKE